MQLRLDKYAAFALTMAELLFDADYKLAILEGFGEDEVRGRFDNSYGADTYDILCRTLVLDSIRDIWAFTLDRDARAPSVAHIWAELSNPELRSAFREQYDDSAAFEWWGPEMPVDESDRLMAPFRRQRRIDALAHFDAGFHQLEVSVPELLQSDRAQRIDRARKRVVAHYNMVKSPDGHAVFDVGELGLQWDDSRQFLTQAEPVILGLATFLARSSFDVPDFKRVHRLRVDDFFSRLMGKGPNAALPNEELS